MSVLTTQVDGALGLIIPDSFAEEVGISPNSEVYVRTVGSVIMISAPRQGSVLDDLLGQINETNLHRETTPGSDLGMEAI